jgi:hypothetical protein
MADRRYALIGHTHASSSLALNGLTDVTAPSPTTGDVLRWNGSAWVNYPDSNYAAASHTHVIADVTDFTDNSTNWDTAYAFTSSLTATAAEINLLDLSGLTAGWVLSADTATTASWKAPASTALTPWASDIDGAGFGLDNIDRLEIQASGVATDTATFTHDGTDFNTVFANTTDWNISGITAIQAGAVDADFDAITATSYGGILEANLVDKTAVESISGVWTHTSRLDLDGTSNSNFLEFRNTTTADLLRVFMSGTLWEMRPGGTATLGFGHSFSTNAWFCDTDFSAETVTATDLQVTLASGQALIQSTSLGTGETTSLQLEDQSGNLLDAGFNVMRRAASANTSFTLGAEECGQYWDKTSSTAYTVTLAASTDLDFPVYGVVTLMNKFTSGDVTVTEGSGTTLYYMDPVNGRVDTAGGCTIAPGGVATVHRAASTSYYIWGSGITA